MAYNARYSIDNIIFGLTVSDRLNAEKILHVTRLFMIDLLRVEGNVKADYVIHLIQICELDKMDTLLIARIRANQTPDIQTKYLGFVAKIYDLSRGRLIYFPDLQLFVKYDYQQREVTIAGDEENPWYQFYVGWFIRELYRVETLQRGQLLIHAGGISQNSTGILFTGQKGAGKTSILFEMLRNGADYLANDKVICKLTNDGIILSEIPIFIGVGVGTLTRYPDFQPWLRDFSDLTIYQYKLIDDSIKNSFKHEQKLLLTVGELLSKFPQSKFVTKVPLRAIIELEFNNAEAEARIEEIESKAEKYKILQENLCFANDEVFTDIFNLVTIGQERVQEILDYMIENISFYHLTHNYQGIGSFDKVSKIIGIEGEKNG